MSILKFLVLLLCLFWFGCVSSSNFGSIGVNYGRVANNLPAPSKVVELLQANGINRVKIFDANPSVVSALADSSIKVTVAMPNQLLSSAAADINYTNAWLKARIVPFYPRTTIEAIAMGNEVFMDSKNTPFLVPAMQNMFASLLKLGLAGDIKISSPLAFSALETTYPPSSARFRSDLIKPVIEPMLNFLHQTRSYLMINFYPFFAYEANKDTISLDFVLLRPNNGVKDPANGNVYMSLFEAQLDAVHAALDALYFDDIRVVVTETGWPSAGGDKEFGAGVANAASYNGNLVRRVLTGGGTPLRPNNTLNVFLFALYNENQKNGPVSERNYGLFYPNQQKVYDIPLSLYALNSTGPGVDTGEGRPSEACKALNDCEHPFYKWGNSAQPRVSLRIFGILPCSLLLLHFLIGM
ncbi:glucan endo-1,3-beta-glucosidase-like [Apium graveolens]|uniref:glucan endo-1,3-beta-glucosidase-like n=1 Tax=Apium graveolens TaxID=4045 RepID=UPI003D79D9D4